MTPSPPLAAGPLRAWPFRARAARGRGMTLIEVLVVMVIIALLTGGMVAGTGQLAGARLKRSATTVASAIKVAYTRATATSKSVRIVFDMDGGKIWLEEAEQPMLLQTNKDGTAGADPATEAEKVAVAEGERLVKGPQAPRAQFRPVKALGFEDPDTGKGGRELERNIKISTVETTHDEEAKTSGRGYLYFWPGGQTERAVIQLRIGPSTLDSDTLSLVVSPLTGKVTIKNGPVPLNKTDGPEKDGSEREDRGL